MIPPGTYRGRGVEGSAQLTIASTGSEQIVIEVDVQTGGPTPQRVSVYLPFTERAAPFSVRRLRALGWQGTDPSRMTGLDANEVDVEVRDETYNGRQVQRVEIIAPRETKPLEGAARRAFVDRVAALAAETASTVDPPAEPAADNEVPF